MANARDGMASFGRRFAVLWLKNKSILLIGLIILARRFIVLDRCIVHPQVRHLIIYSCLLTDDFPPVHQPIIPVGNFAWLRHFIRHKNDPSGELVQIVAAYPEYAVISRSSAKDTDTISWKHLACHSGPIHSDSTSSSSFKAQSAPLIQPEATASEVRETMSNLTSETPPKMRENEVKHTLSPEVASPAQLDLSLLSEWEPPSPYMTRFGRAIVRPARYGFS